MKSQAEATLAPTEAIVLALVSRMLTKVEAFNKGICGMPIPSSPQCLPEAKVERSLAAFQEEGNEFAKACEEDDVLEAADGLVDLIFFALGRLTEMGIPAAAVFEGVAAANMGKVRGNLSKRPGWDGHDAVKPADWTPPDHSWLLNFSLADVEKARLFDEMSPAFQRITRLRAAKGRDYNNVPGGRDAYFPFGHMSYLHMIHTKSLRIQSLVTSQAKPNFESLADSVDDLINYAAFYSEALTEGRVSGVAGKAA